MNQDGINMKRGKILVVEENDSVRDLLLQALSRMGYKVTTARNGEKGMDLFNKENFDFILCDLTMPGMDGWTLAKMVKDKLPYIPICLMTGWEEEEIRPMIRESAADFVIFKPFRLHKLKETVERMLGYGI